MKRVNHLSEIDEGIDKLWIITLVNTVFTILTGIATFLALFQK